MIAFDSPFASQSQQHYEVATTIASKNGSANSPPCNVAFAFIVKAPMMSDVHFFAVVGSPVTRGSHLDSEEFVAFQDRNVTAMSDLARQWRCLLLDPHAERNANALTRTVKPLFSALSQFGPGAIDLRDLPVERVNGVHLAVILRSTMTRKRETLGWDDALRVAREALRRDGIDENDALVGLG